MFCKPMLPHRVVLNSETVFLIVSEMSKKKGKRVILIINLLWEKKVTVSKFLHFENSYGSTTNCVNKLFVSSKKKSGIFLLFQIFLTGNFNNPDRDS